MSKVVIHFDADVGRINRESFARLLKADLAYAAGDDRDADAHLYFESYAMLHAALTPGRLELVRSVRQRPARSIRALSEAIGRDYRRVHADVVALADLGLVERDGSGVRALFDDVEIRLDLAVA